MANETIGEITHHCGTVADVRKDKNGRLYLFCSNCGQLKYNLTGGQDYILNEAVMFSPDHQRNVTAAPEKKTVDVGRATLEIPADQVYEKVSLDDWLDEL